MNSIVNYISVIISLFVTMVADYRRYLTFRRPPSSA